MDQVIKHQIKHLTLTSDVVVSVTPTTINVNNTLSDGIAIADVVVNGKNSTIYAPKHQDITYKLDKEEFSELSSEFITEKKLQEKNYAKIDQIPLSVSKLINDVGYLISSDISSKQQLSTEFAKYQFKGDYALVSEVSSKTELIDEFNKYQIKGDYVQTSDISSKSELALAFSECAKTADLPDIATPYKAGIIKLGSIITDHNYPVQIDSNCNAYVYVPWTDTLVSVDNDTIRKDDTGILYVNQITKSKITDFGNYLTADTFIPSKVADLDDASEYAKKTDIPGIASDDIQGTIALGYHEIDRNYAVKVEDGKAYVHVPWTGGGGAVVVDNDTIKQREDNNAIYVNQITKSKITDFGNYLTADTFIPSKTSHLQNDTEFVQLSALNTDNVVLSKNLKFSGNYTLGLKKKTITDEWIAPAGMTLTKLFEELFCGETPDAQPVVTAPTLTLTLKNIGTRVPVGTPINVGYELSFNPGKYTTTLNGNTKEQNTNVQPLAYSVMFNNQTLTTQSGTFNTFTPTTAGTLTVEAIVSYSAGDYAKTYNGIATTIRIEAGSKTNLKSFEVYEELKTYYYVGTDRDTTVDKAFLTSTETGHSFDNGAVLTKTFDVPYKTMRIVYAIPGNHAFQKLEIPGLGEVTDNDETFEQPYGNEVITIDGTSYRVIQYKAPVGKKFPELTLKFTFI